MVLPHPTNPDIVYFLPSGGWSLARQHTVYLVDSQGVHDDAATLDDQHWRGPQLRAPLQFRSESCGSVPRQFMARLTAYDPERGLEHLVD
jgi:hypothetical protein